MSMCVYNIYFLFMLFRSGCYFPIAFAACFSSVGFFSLWLCVDLLVMSGGALLHRPRQEKGHGFGSRKQNNSCGLLCY